MDIERNLFVELDEKTGVKSYQLWLKRQRTEMTQAELDSLASMFIKHMSKDALKTSVGYAKL